MKTHRKEAIEYFGKTDDANIQKLHQLVAKAIDEESLKTLMDNQIAHQKLLKEIDLRLSK